MHNWWVITLLLAAGQGILLGLALAIPGRKRDPSNPFLGLIMLIISLELLNAWGIQVKYHSSPDAFPFWLLESYLVLPASLWLFIKSNATPGFRFKKKYLLLYVPAFIEIVVETVTYIQYRATGRIVRLLDIKAWFFFTEILPIVGMIVALTLYARNLRVFSQLNNRRTDTGSRIFTMKMNGLFIAFVLLVVCWCGEVILHLPIFIVVEVILVAFLFVLGYIGYARPSFFDKAKNQGRRPMEAQLFIQYDDKKESTRLVEVFEQQALHTRPGLTVEELSRELDLPVRYVSYLINTYFATNFHSFVNNYRVKEVIRKINDPAEKHKTLLALAFESGFNSKSTFNQVFKTHTGQTPSQYLK
jgi:AraC-like DNA-binding protein